MQYLLAHSVKEQVANRGDGGGIYTWYTVGDKCVESGEFYIVKEIRVSDSFSQFHVEVDLEDFGTLWIYDVKKIIFTNATRREIQSNEEGDSGNENTDRLQQGFS